MFLFFTLCIGFAASFDLEQIQFSNEGIVIFSSNIVFHVISKCLVIEPKYNFYFILWLISRRKVVQSAICVHATRNLSTTMGVRDIFFRFFVLLGISLNLEIVTALDACKLFLFQFFNTGKAVFVSQQYHGQSLRKKRIEKTFYDRPPRVFSLDFKHVKQAAGADPTKETTEQRTGMQF